MNFKVRLAPWFRMAGGVGESEIATLQWAVAGTRVMFGCCILESTTDDCGAAAKR